MLIIELSSGNEEVPFTSPHPWLSEDFRERRTEMRVRVQDLIINILVGRVSELTYMISDVE